MKRTLLAAWLIVLIASGLRAQSPEDQAKCNIAGTVVDAISNQPLRGAAVTIRGPMGSGGSSWKITSAVADADGHFSFPTLAPGRYMISATHAGYVTQGPGGGGLRARTVVVAPGQNVDDFTVTLMPGSVITGHITDAASKPLEGVTVQVLKRRYQSGGLGLSEESSAESNKAGEYRIASLKPGKYYLRAMFSEPPPAKPGSTLAYVPTYYPGTLDQASSVPLVLSPGEEMAGMDLILKLQPTFTVKGRVVDALTKLPVPESELTLAPTDGTAGSSPYNATGDAKGNFELRAIPAGDYVLTATNSSASENSGNKSGRKSINVQDANLNGVDVLIARGVEVSGRIRVEGKTSVDMSQMTGTLESTESAAGDSASDVDNASVKPDGSFVFHDVSEGSYRINISPIPQGLFMKGDSGEAITVTRGQPLRGLDLVLSSGAARIEGTALNDQQPAAGAAVVLVPALGRRSQPRYYKRAVTDRQGRFSLQGIIPGDYEVFAFEEMQRDAYMDPDFLAQYEGRGKEVTLKDGDTQTLQLDVISSE